MRPSPAASSPARSGWFDAVILDPVHYTVAPENAWVRVLRVRYAPGPSERNLTENEFVRLLWATVGSLKRTTVHHHSNSLAPADVHDLNSASHNPNELISTAVTQHVVASIPNEQEDRDTALYKDIFPGGWKDRSAESGWPKFQASGLITPQLLEEHTVTI